METARKTLITSSILIALAAVIFCLYLSKTVILYVVIALLLVFAINPLVLWIEKRGVKRNLAILLADLFLLIIVSGILATVIIPLITQGSDLLQNLPHISDKIFSNPTLISLNQKYHISESLNDSSKQLTDIVSGGGSSLLIFTSIVISKVFAIISVLVLAFLIQFEGRKIWQGILDLLHIKIARRAERVGTSIMNAVSGFVLGNLFISLIAGVVTLITLWILGVPYMFALAALVALFDIIPLIGAAIATIGVGLVALSQGTLTAIIAVAVLLVYQFIEGHIIQPLVYSKSVNLSALIIVLASLLGAEFAGIVGVLLAIPLASIIQILGIEAFIFYKANKNNFREIVTESE